MRADDERDPLDSWLNQQAKPLPPPPGTFELITRRARGRKLRKLAVTVVSAAAVAAAVAVAVPVGLNLHLTPPPARGGNVAEGGPTHQTESTEGSATTVRRPARLPRRPTRRHPVGRPPCRPTSSRPRSRSSARRTAG